MIPQTSLCSSPLKSSQFSRFATVGISSSVFAHATFIYQTCNNGQVERRARSNGKPFILIPIIYHHLLTFVNPKLLVKVLEVCEVRPTMTQYQNMAATWRTSKSSCWVSMNGADLRSSGSPRTPDRPRHLGALVHSPQKSERYDGQDYKW